MLPAMPPRSKQKPTAAMRAPIELAIVELGARGDGIADYRGERVFVPLALPGERVSARILGRRGDGLAAELIQITSPAPERQDAACRHFGRCGGCAAQHLAAPAYAGWKRGIVADALARRGLDAGVVEAPIPVPPATRRRAEFTLVGRRSQPVAGFAQRASHAIVDLAECPVALPEIVAMLAPLRQCFAGWLGAGARVEAMVNATASGLDLLLTLPDPPDLALRERLADLAQSLDLARLSWRRAGEPCEPLAARRPFGIRFADVWVELPPGAFLQATEAGEAAIRAVVLEGTGKAARIADLYAGAGTLSLPLAAGARVHAVEGDPDLVAALTRAARPLGGRLGVEARDLARSPLAAPELDRFDAVVFDPPRTGAREQAAELALSKVAHVIGVSCHPGSFARDARLLVDGGYRLLRVLPIDQFLWSSQIELVAWFRR